MDAAAPKKTQKRKKVTQTKKKSKSTVRRRRRRKKFQKPSPIKMSYDVISQQQQQKKKKTSKTHHNTLVISQDAQNLLCHTRNKKVRWSPNDACFIIKGPKGKAVRKTGLASMLKRTFWSDYDYRKVIRLTETNTTASKNLYRQAQLNARKNPERRSAAGLVWEDIPRQVVTGRGHKRRFERGSAVHEEICYYAREGLEKFMTRYPEPEMFTLGVILALKKYGFTPIYAELPIYDDIIGYATAVDLLCVDQKAKNTKDLGRLVICELKTASELYAFEQGHKEMLGAAAFMNNSSLNQARLQAYFAEMTLRKCYNITDCISVVIVVHNQGVAGFIVPDDIITHGSRIYQYAVAAENNRLALLKSSRGKGRRRRKNYSTTTKT